MSKTRNTQAAYGNFLDNPFAFDNEYFQISPREAKAMDPQQRLLLHTALGALEDAGYAPDISPSFQRDTFGVYIGVATEDYIQNSRDNIDVYYSTGESRKLARISAKTDPGLGTLRAFLSGRISYAFNFGGPSVVVDTACSSSTVAIYQACRALQNGDCTSALAGAVNVISSPDVSPLAVKAFERLTVWPRCISDWTELISSIILASVNHSTSRLTATREPRVADYLFSNDWMTLLMSRTAYSVSFVAST